MAFAIVPNPGGVPRAHVIATMISPTTMPAVPSGSGVCLAIP